MTFVEKILLITIAFIIGFIVIAVVTFIANNQKIDYNIRKNICIYTLILEIVVTILFFILLFH